MDCYMYYSTQGLTSGVSLDFLARTASTPIGDMFVLWHIKVTLYLDERHLEEVIKLLYSQTGVNDGRSWKLLLRKHTASKQL